ncbi:MAG: exodeoxyribonuclease VII large subunit [Sulfuritalea sp.]|nr:exodeoxyribonuclease VII large subunit [Sulfuritalea sp.]
MSRDFPALETEMVSAAPARIWTVSALCRAISDTLDARFNPVRVTGELSGFVQAASGHCYFSLKDDSGQMRCAMFKRAASGLDFQARDGQRVEVSGRLGVYEARGELQLVVERMVLAGEGTLFEQFLRLKAKLEAAGLFDPVRKRPIPAHVRGIGVVTSLGAAALHDVVSAFARRVPHIPVVLAPAAVQGAGSAGELCKALTQLYQLAQAKDSANQDPNAPAIDVILLVRGGGAMEDLWSFNDEQLARTVLASPVPVIVGVGHETDFTIADFVADVRAPTPTAAAELCATTQQSWLDAADQMQERLRSALTRLLDRQSQRLDLAAVRIGKPSGVVAGMRHRLDSAHQRMGHALHRDLEQRRHRVQRAELRLGLLDPTLVLSRGYAWLTDAQGQALTRVSQLHSGQSVGARLADGSVELTVQSVRDI